MPRLPKMEETLEGRGTVVFRIRQSPKVQFPSVEAAFAELHSHGLLPKYSTLSYEDGWISISFRRPPRIPRKRSTSSYKRWHGARLLTVQVMISSIQAQHAMPKIVERVGHLQLVA